MKISALRKAGAEVLAGKWVDDLPGLPPEVGFLVVGANHPEARRFASDAYGNLDDAGRKDPAKLESIQKEQIVAVFVRGWRGFTEDDGSELPFSRERLADLVNGEETGLILVPAINAAIEKVGVVEVEKAKADAKN